jgi:hypothetical protein
MVSPIEHGILLGGLVACLVPGRRQIDHPQRTMCATIEAEGALVEARVLHLLVSALHPKQQPASSPIRISSLLILPLLGRC